MADAQTNMVLDASCYSIYTLRFIVSWSGRFPSCVDFQHAFGLRYIIMPGERKWYVVQTYASYEKRVKDDLTQRIKAMKMQDKIFTVLIPTETNTVIKDGKSREVTRKLYPGYVMIEMVLDEQSWYTVRHTPGVTGFIGAGTHPMPLSEDEVEKIMSGMKKSEESPKVEIDLKVGDMVRVIAEGVYKGFTGPVVEINAKKGKVKFRHDILGGSIIDTDYKDLEKI